MYDRLSQAFAQLEARTASRLRTTELCENEQLVSLDVSLFTHVTLCETVKLTVQLSHQSGALDGHLSKVTAGSLMLLARENVHNLSP